MDRKGGRRWLAVGVMDGSIVLGPATCNVDVDVDVDVDVMSMIPFLVWRCMAVECMARMEEGSRHCPHEEVEGTRTGSTRLCMHYAVCIQCNCRESLNNGRSTSLGTAPARSTSTRCLLLFNLLPISFATHSPNTTTPRDTCDTHCAQRNRPTPLSIPADVRLYREWHIEATAL